jgi:hypothetical protein
MAAGAGVVRGGDDRVRGNVRLFDGTENLVSRWRSKMIHPQALIKMFGYNLRLIDEQITGMTHEESLFQSPIEGNCINWVLGHLVSSRTTPLKLIGAQPVWTEVQRRFYRNGSLQHETEGIFPLGELVKAIYLTQERLISRLQQLTYEDMCIPSGYQDNTIGDSLAYFHFHEAQHIGQLLILREFTGKKSVYPVY